jgi:hypothetical protein
MIANIQKILDLILSNDSFAKELSERNPKIDADIISFKLNPNCTCKSKIVRHLEENSSEIEFSNQWISSHMFSNNTTPIEITSGTPIKVSFPSELSKEEQERLKKEKQRMVLKSALPQSEWKNFKDVIGEVVEIAPNPNKYKELLTVAREKWFYNGLNVIETVKTNPSTGEENIVWLVFFY